MPQMAPMIWTWLFITFIMALALMNIVMYFKKQNSPTKTILMESNKNNKNWMW